MQNHRPGPTWRDIMINLMLIAFVVAFFLLVQRVHL